MSAYGALLARPGARRLALASGVGWWSFNGYGLALVLSVEHATGSYAAAGASTAAFGTGAAVLAPLRGRVVERNGPAALLALAVAHAAALMAVVVACTVAAAPGWVIPALSGAAGATAPPLVATSRRAWTQVAGSALARTSHALNAGLGEFAAVASPLVTAGLAAATSPALALACLVVGPVAGAWWIAGLSWPSQRERVAPRSGRPLPLVSSGLRWLMGGEVAAGVWLGGLEVAAPALSREAGSVLLAGAPLVALALGGVAATAWAGSTRVRGSASERYGWGVATAALILPMALLAPTSYGITAVALGAGLALGAITVALFELLDEVVDHRRTIEAFTWLTTAGAAGVAAGAAMAGVLADAAATHALLVVAVAPLVGAGLAAGRPRA